MAETDSEPLTATEAEAVEMVRRHLEQHVGDKTGQAALEALHDAEKAWRHQEATHAEGLMYDSDGRGRMGFYIADGPTTFDCVEVSFRMGRGEKLVFDIQWVDNDELYDEEPAEE